ncbi:PREDICTED: uncharacterized protein LOC101309697 [Fragaria vesca subsp. vesca]|uniref:uncharacterized protein LOC101309697 n=1 Tax=Fragaria vesca subsp. vesca TaxID=101020 RepID=UPI0002C31917|nr:PREDICTED: uncharacterized protein LOC101309697 [Fragaria vesca subsp. vesca]
MDEGEFRRLLLLFPVVRSRDYHAESEKSKESTSKSAESEALKEWHDAWDDGEKKDMEKETRDGHDAFWEKLKLVAERKVGATEAERFCKAFQRVHKKLVYEELSPDAAKTFLSSS